MFTEKLYCMIIDWLLYDKFINWGDILHEEDANIRNSIIALVVLVISSGMQMLTSRTKLCYWHALPNFSWW